MKTIPCSYCGKDFIPVNGNMLYCSYEHYLEAKKERQKIVEDLIKEFRKGIYKNLKTFKILLSERGREDFSLLMAKDLGLDENAYYGTRKDKDGNEWYRVADYYFRVSIEQNNQLLKLFKKN